MRFRVGRNVRLSLPARTLLLLLLLGTLVEVRLVYSAYRRRALEEKDRSAAIGKIFIATIHWNDEVILRERWTAAVADLASYLGPDNVFVSLQESGSWDGSKDALLALDAELETLNIRRKIILDDTTHEDEINKTPTVTGWINTPRGRTELRRIPYLSRLRNLVLGPLEELAEQGERFDKILWVNDVILDVQDILKLINTRNGIYAAACSLDFAHPYDRFYDTFALRDAEGHPAIMHSWPYFRSRKSRNAIKSGSPVSVTSCWNGVVSMDARPFYNTTNPLQFRGVPDSLAEYHVEGSECCLIHLDNPLSPGEGVWLNPLVRVRYNSAAYNAVHVKAIGTYMSARAILWGIWENRLRRWFTTPRFESSIVSRKLRSWRAKNKSSDEYGVACLINEMQVLIKNGWAHV